MPDLKVIGLTKRFGGIVAVDGVSFEVREGEIVGLIGPNGAGKTTLFNCISRFYSPEQGDVSFGDVNVLRLKPHSVISCGIARTFQQAELFKSMSVQDNIMVGLHMRTGVTQLASLVAAPNVWLEERKLRRVGDELIEFVGLGPYRDLLAGALPFGLQKRVDLARALVSSPRLVLLDEPAAGLSHEELRELATLIRRIRDDLKVTVLLVEHHMALVMGISDRVVVLDFGRKIADGTPAEVRDNEAVITAYLGKANQDARG